MFVAWQVNLLCLGPEKWHDQKAKLRFFQNNFHLWVADQFKLMQFAALTFSLASFLAPLEPNVLAAVRSGCVAVLLIAHVISASACSLGELRSHLGAFSSSRDMDV